MELQRELLLMEFLPRQPAMHVRQHRTVVLWSTVCHGSRLPSVMEEAWINLATGKSTVGPTADLVGEEGRDLLLFQARRTKARRIDQDEPPPTLRCECGCHHS